MYSYRNWPQLVTQVRFSFLLSNSNDFQVVIPLLILGFITWLSNFAISSGGSDYTRIFNCDRFGPSRVIVQAPKNSKAAAAYKGLIQNWTGSEVNYLLFLYSDRYIVAAHRTFAERQPD